MEHANIAFLMVAGMLFAIMIMSLIAFVFSNLTILPTEEDSRIHAEQAAAFNEEYLAYDKKIMYGTDVISVLNKALSNNEKYIKERFVTGGGYNTDFIIDIQVEIKKDLQEEIRVMYVEQTDKGVVEKEYVNEDGPREDINKNGIGDESEPLIYGASDIFTKPKDKYQDIIYIGSGWSSLGFKTQTIETKVGKDVYHLLGTDTEEPVPNYYTNDQLNADNTLKQLLTHSTVMQQTIKNRNSDTFKPEGWSQAIWKPAIYDLKTRKFKCLGNETVFSEKTGRVIKMVFEEI